MAEKSLSRLSDQSSSLKANGVNALRSDSLLTRQPVSPENASIQFQIDPSQKSPIVLASRVKADGAANESVRMLFMNVPVQTNQRLILIKGSSNGVGANVSVAGAKAHFWPQLGVQRSREIKASSIGRRVKVEDASLWIRNIAKHLHNSDLELLIRDVSRAIPRCSIHKPS